MRKCQKGIVILPVLVVILLLGVLLYLAFRSDVLNRVVPRVETTPTSKPVKIITSDEVAEETANWTVYVQPELGFSIKYPKEKVIINTDYSPDWHGVVFTYLKYKNLYQPFGSDFSILSREPGGGNPIDGLKSDTSLQDGEYVNIEYEQAQINNAYGIRNTSGFSSDYDYYLTDKNKTGPVLRVIVSKNNNEDDIETFVKMLRTFEFVR